MAGYILKYSAGTYQRKISALEPDTRQNVYVQTETAEKGTDKTYE